MAISSGLHTAVILTTFPSAHVYSATGGSGNDIEVYVLTDDEFVNWQNGHSTPTYYNTGRVTQSSINAALPNGGSYNPVLNNRFSLPTSKAVAASVNVSYRN